MSLNRATSLDGSKMMTQEALQTANLLLFFDDLFDSVNGDSKSIKKGKRFRSAVCKKSKHVTFLNNSIKILETMSFVDQTRVCVPPVDSDDSCLDDSDDDPDFVEELESFSADSDTGSDYITDSETENISSNNQTQRRKTKIQWTHVLPENSAKVKPVWLNKLEYISSVMDAVDDANDVDTSDDLENTQHCILNDENNSSQDSTMSNSQANNVEKAKDNVTPKKQFKSPTLAHVPSRKRRFDDSMVNEAYEAMKQTLAAKKPKDVFTICGEEVAVTLRNLPTTYAQAIVQHKISTLLFEAKLGNYNYPVAQQPQQQAPQAQHQHYYPLSQQYFCLQLIPVAY
ncbi:hypothetical protein RN001_005619 [Aquatica leii]|uniref:Uncharacterized protein n=1 Tax=Aquatica leii TaxID=1421715 RepID=A0AAN7SS36_9COLE|nr:hypothetical protein RN001_005619 [Aquatica leii]